MNQRTVPLSMDHLAKWIVGWTVTILLSAAAVGARGSTPEDDVPEGKGLVYGGQFSDRFLPMPVQGKLTSETWGADRVKPRFIDNGIEESEWSYWGGQARLAADGKYHLYVARWRNEACRDHM